MTRDDEWLWLHVREDQVVSDANCSRIVRCESEIGPDGADCIYESRGWTRRDTTYMLEMRGRRGSKRFKIDRGLRI